MKSAVVKALLTISALATLPGCGGEVGEFYAAALGLNQPRVIIASQLATNLGVYSYTVDGVYQGRLVDYFSETGAPRGIALINPFTIAISLDSTDEVDAITLAGSRSKFISNNLLTGTLGKLISDSSRSNYYIVETNGIERFTSAGVRIPATGGAYISGGAQAPCAALASLRALVLNNSGNLIAVQSGTTAANRYTLAAASASACATVALPTNANDVINHSDGNLYFVGTNSQVYRMSQTMTGITSIFNNTTVISTPTALVELPNGNLLVASDATDALEIITTAGTYVRTFAKDTNTQQLHSLFVVRGQ